MNNFVTIHIPRGVAASLLLSLLPLLSGSAQARDGGGTSAGVTVTATLVTCRPVITTTKYEVEVKPSSGLKENAAESGESYYPSKVATIDNSSCDYDVDVTGDVSSVLISSPNAVLDDINARISLDQVAGGVGGDWTESNNHTKSTTTVKAGKTLVLYAGINPLTSHTAYNTGSHEGALTLTLTPH